ncbi:MAG: CoA transferase subunit A [Acidimicrobiales bacterium]
MTVPVGTRAARRDLEQRHRPRVDKRMGVAEAAALVSDGDHVAVGGTLYSRTPMALLFGVLRAGRSRLALSRPLTCYEAELFLVSGAADRVVTSWMGIGLRWGLSPILRRYVEDGRASFEEWSHLALGLRYKAGAIGVPFLPTYTMLGSDIMRAREVATVTCPYTGDELLAVPALNPDVALIHVHRCDVHGNAQVDGYRHMDVDMARAARTVVVSAEQIVSEAEIRSHPETTMLPHFTVDAVVEAPFGSYPHECYGLYEADLQHFDDYVAAQRSDPIEAVRAYVERHVTGPADFAAFLDGFGPDRLAHQARAAAELVP